MGGAPNYATGILRLAIITDGFDGATFHRLFATSFLFLAPRLFDDEGVAVFLMHFEMVWRRENTGIAGNAFLIDVESTGHVVFKLLRLVSHGLKLVKFLACVILSFPTVEARVLPGYDV